MRSSSTWSRPAVSTMTTFLPSRCASATPCFATATGSVPSESTATPTWPPEHAQLLDRGGPLEVGADEQHLTPLVVLEQARQLRRGGRLPGSLEPGEHDDRRWLGRDRELAGRTAERLDELLVHDLDDLLPRAQALRDLRTRRALLDPRDEALHDAHVHVGFEQREPDLARDLVDVRLGQTALAAQPLEDALEPVAQRLEHG